MPVPIYQAKADLFRTLGHPVRIRVLELLQTRPHAVHELLAAIPEVEASNLSHQLAALRQAGIIASSRDGKDVLYALTAEHVSALISAARLILTSMLEGQSDLAQELRALEALG